MKTFFGATVPYEYGWVSWQAWYPVVTEDAGIVWAWPWHHVPVWWKWAWALSHETIDEFPYAVYRLNLDTLPAEHAEAQHLLDQRPWSH